MPSNPTNKKPVPHREKTGCMKMERAKRLELQYLQMHEIHDVVDVETPPPADTATGTPGQPNPTLPGF